jgi:hypothetical protein
MPLLALPFLLAQAQAQYEHQLWQCETKEEKDALTERYQNELKAFHSKLEEKLAKQREEQRLGRRIWRKILRR